MNIKIYPAEYSVNIFLGGNSGRRNEFSCVGLALGWGLRNIYFLESDRRKSPYLRGKLNL